MKQGDLNRKQYDRIRKMDHKQMQDYFKGVYDSGYEAGIKAATEDKEAPELIGLDEELQGIRGIGGAKARAICEVVRNFLERRTSNKESVTGTGGM